MARPIEYDRQEVLEKAVQTFWMNGYEGTTVSMLISATGMTSRSMYNLFGSKNGLFKAALENYYDRGIHNSISMLKKETGLAAIRGFVMRTLLAEPLNGCMFVNTLSDRNVIEPDCLGLVERHFKNMEKIFAEKIVYARHHERYKGDPKLRARQIVLLLQGMAQYSKSEIALTDLRKMADDYLKLMGI